MNQTLPLENDLDALFRRHFGDPKTHEWRCRLRHRFGYFAPEQWYSGVVDRLLNESSRWIDVGGGKSVFPFNPKLSTELAQRCELLVGVDPSDNIHENPFVHQQIQGLIENFRSGERFNLATFRMVAEHIPTPESTLETLATLVEPGGLVVVFTPNRWTPVSIAASLIPNQWHSVFTHLLWGTKEEDVFPTCYKMNTRKRLGELFGDYGFKEIAFQNLDNCETFSRFRATYFVELSVRKILRRFGITYPENDLLGVYQRV